MTLEVAKEWGVPPWVIEEDAPWRWMERWRVMREEMATYQARQRKQQKTAASSEGGEV